MDIAILDKIYDGLKFKDAEYNEKTNICVLNFLYNPDNFKPDDENKEFILLKVKELIGDYVQFQLVFTSSPLDKRTIANHTYTTIINNFPALSKQFTYEDVMVEIEKLKVNVKLRLTPSNYDYAKSLNREELVENKLKESFFADFTVTFEKKEDQITTENAIESNMELMSSIKEAEEKTVFELSDITDIVGKNEYTVAIDFTKVKSAIENVAICGEVTNVQKKSYKRKITKKGEEQEIDRVFYNLTIKNENRFMYCSIFPKQSDENKCNLIDVGMKVCCFGSFREYAGKLNFTAQTIARCNFRKEEIKSSYKHVNEEYHTVFPQEYINYEQSGLFDEEKVFPGSYVVFDVETTGLDSSKDEIIEIGACKIVNGKICEVFSTFVKPSKKIPSEITELTGIDEQMVKDAPTINYVLPDFYKFCYNSTIVAHNASFDMGFVYAVARKFSYKFDNQIIDTLELSRQKIKGLRNYKLGTLADYFNVSLKNAHRAVHDATATAKIFIKLM